MEQILHGLLFVLYTIVGFLGAWGLQELTLGL